MPNKGGRRDKAGRLNEVSPPLNPLTDISCLSKSVCQIANGTTILSTWAYLRHLLHVLPAHNALFTFFGHFCFIFFGQGSCSNHPRFTKKCPFLSITPACLAFLNCPEK